MKRIELGGDGEKIDILTAGITEQVRKQIELRLGDVSPEVQDAIVAKIKLIEKAAASRAAPADRTEAINRAAIIQSELVAYERKIALQEKLDLIEDLLIKLDPSLELVSLIKALDFQANYNNISKIDIKSRFLDDILGRLEKIEISFGAEKLKGKTAWRIIRNTEKIEPVILLGVDVQGRLQIEGRNTILNLGSDIFASKEDAQQHLNVLALGHRNNDFIRKGSSTGKAGKGLIRQIIRGETPEVENSVEKKPRPQGRPRKQKLLRPESLVEPRKNGSIIR